GAMVAPGTPVARVVDVSRVKIAAGVPERYAGEIQVGAPAVAVLDVMGGREFEGTLAFVGTEVEDANGTGTIEIAVPDSDGVLKPGRVANVGVMRRSLEEALVVPQEGVVRVENGFIVYVAAQQGSEWRAEARPVQTGASRGGR